VRDVNIGANENDLYHWYYY